MFLCLVLFNMTTSYITFFVYASSLKYYLLIDLTAANFPDRECKAKLTLPKAPLPKTFPIL